MSNSKVMEKKWIRVVGSLFFWASAWPLVALILILIGSATTFFLFFDIIESAINANPASTLRGLLLLAGGLLSGFFYLIIRKLRKKESVFFTQGRYVLSAYTSMGIILTILLVVSVSLDPPVKIDSSDNGLNQSITINPTTPTLNKEPALVDILVSMGVDESILESVSIEYSVDFEDTVRLSNPAGIYQSFVNLEGKLLYGAIKIRPDLGAEEERVALAHEYLHHVWAMDIEPNTSIRDRLTSDLITMHTSSYEGQLRVEEYSEQSILIPTELFSFYCTEFSDVHLTNFVIQQCNKYIDRSSLTFWW